MQFTHHSAALKTAFAISRGAKTSAETVRVELTDGDAVGRGESVPYGRYGETVENVLAEIEAVSPDLKRGATRADLLTLMKPGAARCAVDCALWDLEAKRTGRPVWSLARLPEPRPVETAVTLSLDAPEAMANAARAAPGRILKLKLDGKGDIDRLAAVRAAREDAILLLDANEGLSDATFKPLARAARDLKAAVIEQPFPAGADEALSRIASPVAVCADESAHTAEDMETLVKRYDVVNVKLDKAGGLTAGLDMVSAARKAGMGVMVGCMVAGSLSMAPALLLAQLADVADLDGPLWLEQDIENGLTYAEGRVAPPSAALWG